MDRRRVNGEEDEFRGLMAKGGLVDEGWIGGFACWKTKEAK